MEHRSLATCVSLLLLATHLTSCSTPPEERIRRCLANGARAVESGDRAAAAEAISADYRDERGRDKAGVLAGLALLTRGRRIHVLLRIEEVRLGEPGRARAAVVAALAGRPAKDFGSLDDAWTDLYRLHLDLVEEGGIWRVRAASWTSIGVADLF